MLAVLVGLVSLAATSAWFFYDRTPPSWDDSYYLTKSLDLYDTLMERGAGAYAARFLSVMRTKPPLIAVLPTPVYRVLGRRYRAAYAVNLLFLALMFAAVYRIARTFAGPRAGLIAVAALATIPIVYSLSHWFLVECGLTALVCAAIAVIAGWDESSGAARAAALGVLFGLGLLMKASFPVYVAAPIAGCIVRWRKSALTRKPILAFAVPVLLIAGPWYLVNCLPMLATALNAGSAATAKIYETGEALSLRAIGQYLFNVANAAPWLYLAAIAAAALIGASSLQPRARRGVVLALYWLLPLVFLAAGHYRDIRYAAPLYPAAALLFAWMADAAIRKAGAAAAIGVSAVILLGCFSMLQHSFGGQGKRLELGGLLLDVRRLSYARSYDSTDWPHREVLAAIYAAANSGGGGRRQVLLGTDSVRFNAENFTLAAVQEKFPLEIGTTAYIADAVSVARAADQASYFVFKDGGESDQIGFNGVGATAVRQVRDGGSYRQLLSRALPDGGTAYVFANAPPGERPAPSGPIGSAGPGGVPSDSVTFAGRLQLAGIDAALTGVGLDVKYRWRCVGRLDRDYWCFTHVVDPSGKVIGYLDHRLGEAGAPARAWQPGDTALEHKVFPLAQRRAGDYVLLVGIYYPASGERLRITESTLPVVQDRTAALVRVR